MVDLQVRSFGRLKQQESRKRLHSMRLAKLDAAIARTYTDDVDIRPGAYSAPLTRGRPGMRDDQELYCTFGGAAVFY